MFAKTSLKICHQAVYWTLQKIFVQYKKPQSQLTSAVSKLLVSEFIRIYAEFKRFYAIRNKSN